MAAVQLARTLPNSSGYLLPNTSTDTGSLFPPRLVQMERNHLIGNWTWELMVFNSLHWPLTWTTVETSVSKQFQKTLVLTYKINQFCSGQTVYYFSITGNLKFPLWRLHHKIRQRPSYNTTQSVIKWSSFWEEETSCIPAVTNVKLIYYNPILQLIITTQPTNF